MSKDITPAGVNLFEDLGFEFNEACNMKLKTDLASAIVLYIRAEKMTQAQAAKMTDVTRPEISKLQNAKLDGFSLDKLVNMAQRLGKSVSIEIA